MTRPTPSEVWNICTPAEVAKRTGVPVGTLREWMRRDDFPAPIKPSTGRGVQPWYWWPEVCAWVRAWQEAHA